MKQYEDFCKTTDDNYPMRIGNLYGRDKGTSFAGNVYDINYLSPTINCCSGGNRMPLIVIYGDMNNESE